MWPCNETQDSPFRCNSALFGCLFIKCFWYWGQGRDGAENNFGFTAASLNPPWSSPLCMQNWNMSWQSGFIVKWSPSNVSPQCNVLWIDSPIGLCTEMINRMEDKLICWGQAAMIYELRLCLRLRWTATSKMKSCDIRITEFHFEPFYENER